MTHAHTHTYIYIIYIYMHTYICTYIYRHISTHVLSPAPIGRAPDCVGRRESKRSPPKTRGTRGTTSAGAHSVPRTYYKQNE